MKSDLVCFSCTAEFRFRPNSLAPVYSQCLFTIDSDSSFVAAQIYISFLRGVEDEMRGFLDRYSLRMNPMGISDLPVKLTHIAPTFPIVPPILCKPASTLRIELIRPPERWKLRKRADGGEGITVRVGVQGWKSYSEGA